jgi:predicted DCC family thiol-disulfide oxidoreductase YuxK
MNGSAQSPPVLNIPEGKWLILFDGHCNLCNGAVQFVIKRDRKDKFRFAALSWEVGETLHKTFPELAHADSIVLYDGHGISICSSAALRIAGHLGALWPMMAIFWVVPRPLRDAVYNWIARNRYRWFGKKDTCMLPSAELKNKFLQG